MTQLQAKMKELSGFLLVFVWYLVSINGKFISFKSGTSSMNYKRFLLTDDNTNAVHSLEEFSSCFLTCVPGYEKLAEVCCSTGLDAVCTNLPWNMLKSKMGTCTGQNTTQLPSSIVPKSWQSLEQFASCFLSCVTGYEKLAEVCCETGLDSVCLNLPWDKLMPSLGSCEGLTTSPRPIVTKVPAAATTDAPTTQHTQASFTTTPVVYWLPWGEWSCATQRDTCFKARTRNCSTDNTKMCSGPSHDITLCSADDCQVTSTQTSTLHLATSTPPRVTSTPATTDTCQDDPASTACSDPITLKAICTDNKYAWRFCPRSCGMCDTCWDYLDCSSPSAKSLFCNTESYAVQYCRKSCGKCDHKQPVVAVNNCGDPVANELICELLQTEICICNDPDVKVLCQNYCSNKCATKVTNLSCQATMRRRRSQLLEEVLFNATRTLL